MKVTQEHLKVLEYWAEYWYKDGDYALDSKRPLGNSSIAGDVAEILEIEFDLDSNFEFTKEGQKEYDRLEVIWSQMPEVILQLIQNNKST